MKLFSILLLSSLVLFASLKPSDGGYMRTSMLGGCDISQSTIVPYSVPSSVNVSICGFGPEFRYQDEAETSGRLTRLDLGDTLVVMCIGASTPAQIADAMSRVDTLSRAIILNGCASGQDIRKFLKYDGVWSNAYSSLKARDLSTKDVDVVWIMTDDLSVSSANESKLLRQLTDEFKKLVDESRARFPNAKAAFIVGRTFGGSTDPKHDKVHAWINSAAASQAAESYAGPVYVSDYMSCFAYNSRRNDGLYYNGADFKADGVHLAPAGIQVYSSFCLRWMYSLPALAPYF